MLRVRRRSLLNGPERATVEGGYMYCVAARCLRSGRASSRHLGRHTGSSVCGKDSDHGGIRVACDALPEARPCPDAGIARLGHRVRVCSDHGYRRSGSVVWMCHPSLTTHERARMPTHQVHTWQRHTTYYVHTFILCHRRFPTGHRTTDAMPCGPGRRAIPIGSRSDRPPPVYAPALERGL